MSGINIFSIAIALFIFQNLQAQTKMEDLNFLIGTWKMENKENFETWKNGINGGFYGNSYKIKFGEKVITETLSLKFIDNQIVYEATVLNQNDGQTVLFTLNASESDWISFENSTHDFPKKIQYKKLSINSLQVQVLGENGQGFSYKLVKQDK